MKDCYLENLTNEIIGKLKELRYVQEPDFARYDYITIESNGDYIELIAEDKYKRNEVLEYEKVSNGYTDTFKKNNLSGVYVQTSFI